MLTWRDGRRLLLSRLQERSMTFEELARRLEAAPPARVSGTAVYMTGSPDGLPPALWRTVRHLKVLHERTVLLRIESVQVPFATGMERLRVETLSIPGLYRITVRYGFVEKPNIPRALAHSQKQGLPLNLDDVVYVLGRETLIATSRPGMAIWREKLFAAMARNAGLATKFFRIPSEQVIEIGAHIDL
jgi:KUP system potassium uptake protein